jgi:hypothetical protein
MTLGSIQCCWLLHVAAKAAVATLAADSAIMLRAAAACWAVDQAEQVFVCGHSSVCATVCQLCTFVRYAGSSWDVQAGG